jgi:hypothetical protein
VTNKVLKIERMIVIRRFLWSIIIVSSLLASCYHNKAIVYLHRIEKGNYTIHKYAETIPNWSSYHNSIIAYNESNGSSFGPPLRRGGWGPWSDNGKGIYLDVIPTNENILIFERITRDKQEETKWGCILVKNRTLSQNTEILIPNDNLRKVFPEGIYAVYGFKNEELILKQHIII